jgi:hypothetical protein
MTKAHPDGSMTIDNASVQRLLDYGLLHFTDAGWVIGRWCDLAQAGEAGTAETTKIGSVHEHAARRVRP